jgi:hypothetical protein
VRILPALITVALLATATATHAGNNAGALAYLSWSSGDHATTNTAAGAANNLFIRLERVTPMNFTGAEIDLIWRPIRTAGDFGCFEKLGTFLETNTICSTSGYLNRGSTVPVTTLDDANEYHMAWSCTLPSACAQGNACRMLFETDLCATYGRSSEGCFCLTYCLVTDASGSMDVLTIAGPCVTVDGGSQYCATPAAPTTWGAVKGLYRGD